MKKSKLAKAILIAGLSVITAAGVASAAACKKKDKTDDSGKYTSQYTVTFNLNGATGTAPQNQSVNAGSKATEPPEPVWGGHHFTGWYTVPTGQSSANKFDFNTPINQATTLYAGWEDDTSGDPNPVFVVISEADAYTEFCEGGTGGTEVELVANTAVTLDVPSPLQADEYVVAIIPEDYFTVAGSSPDLAAYNRTLSVVIGADTVTYSKTNQFGLLNAEQEPDLRDLSAVSEVTVTSTEAVTVKCALIPASCFSGEEPEPQEGYSVHLSVDGEVKNTIQATKKPDESYEVASAPEAIEDDDPDTTFYKWYLDEDITTPAVFPLAITQETTLYAGFLENVATPLNAAQVLANNGNSDLTVSGDAKYGKLELKNASGEVKFENSNKCLKVNGSVDMYFTVRGIENTLQLVVASGSGSGAKLELYKVTTPAGEGTSEQLSLVKTYGGSTTTGNYLDETAAGSAQKVTNEVELEEGTYKLVRTNSIRIYNLDIVEKLLKGTPESITASGATADFVVNDVFNSNNLTVELNYSNGRVDVLEPGSYQVVSTGVNMAVSGEYDVSVTYTHAKTQSQFTATYKVYVYKVDSITLGTDRIEKIANSKADNGVYFNQTMQRLYLVNDTLNDDGISVALNCSVTGVEGKTKTFYDRDYTYALKEGDMTSAGMKTVKFTSYGYEAEQKIFVIDSSIYESGDITIKVDSSVADENVATKSGSDYQFQTIGQALDFLELLELDSTVKKTITLAAETYNEKVEVTIPNLTIKGTSDGGSKSTIEYDSLVGLLDPSGYTHVTDSTATLAVRDSAEGFVLDGVVVNNKYCTQSYFDSKLGKDYDEHRALAVLIMADKVIIKNSELNGFQDTIELFTGRQLIKDTTISGLTDFIFGTNNTTYFDNCTIKTIKADRNAADRTGLTSEKAHGGYITAFKGNNKDANDAVKYGAIFVGCHFTAEEGVAEGITSIGRPWGKYAKVAVIECDLGAHIATKSTGTASQDERYVAMSGVAPEGTSTVEFVEYKNTGAGAISEKVGGMTLLADDSAAAPYKDKSVIFGMTNGGVTYEDVWTGEELQVYTVTIKLASDETVVATVKYTSGEILSKSDLSKLVPQEKYPSASADNKEVKIKGFFTDKTGESEYNYAAPLTAEQTLYVVFEETEKATYVTYNLTVPAKGQNYTAETALNDIFSVLATDKKAAKTESIKEGNGSYTKNDKNLSFTSSQFSFTSGGVVGSGALQAGIKFVAAKACTVTCYVAAKYDKDVAIAIYDYAKVTSVKPTNIMKDGEPVEAFENLPKHQTENTVVEYTFELPAGTYAFGGTTGGIYLYGMTVAVQQ